VISIIELNQEEISIVSGGDGNSQAEAICCLCVTVILVSIQVVSSLFSLVWSYIGSGENLKVDGDDEL